jgi:hypothetical protein
VSITMASGKSLIYIRRLPEWPPTGALPCHHAEIRRALKRVQEKRFVPSPVPQFYASRDPTYSSTLSQ